jgi:hypothetical protein
MAAGGNRPNSGRKSAAEEFGTRSIAQSAIIKKYGSLEEGVVALLESREPVLQRWVFEHALGKPVETVQVDGEMTHELTFKVVRASKNRD